MTTFTDISTRVSPVGRAPSEIMIIGDTPSIEDLRKRKVLTGKSGDELWHILRRFAWIDKEDCYATNAILYDWNKPEKSLTEEDWFEIRRSLIAAVERVNPSVILTLGNIPTHALLPETVGHDLETVNALPFRYYLNTPRGESIVIPSFHPSASFRDSSKLGFLINAVKAVREVLQGRVTPVILSELHTEITPVAAHTRLHDTMTALDTEWTTDGSTYIVSLSSHEGKAACVYTREDPLGAMQIAAHVRRPGVTTLLHNALADLPTLAQVGIYPRKWLDTMTVAFLLQYLPLSLKELSYRVLSSTMREYKEVIGEYQDLSEVPDRDSVDQYAASDPNATLRLHNALLPLWYPRMDEVMERDMAIHSMISEMMRHGIPLNVGKLSELDQKLAKINLFRRLRIEQIAKQYGFTEPLKGKKYAGMTFNPGSKKQVADLLYDRMQLGRGQKIDKTKSNRLSAGKKMLAKFKDEHEVVNMLNSWTETETLRTHFISQLPTFLKEDNHIHTDISMTRIPHSGRFACSKPNLMAIPVRSDDGREIRKAFVAEPGWVFISNDLSQIEMRVLAHASQDEAMLRVFRADGDIHSETVGRIFGIWDRDKQDDYKHRLPAKCFHPDTEVLTKTGWKKIVDLRTGEEVIQAIPKDHGEVLLEWAVPLEIFTAYHESKQLVHLQNKSIDIRVTPDHRMCAWRPSGKHFVTTPDKMNTSARYYANAGLLHTGSQGISPTLLRLAIALQADGNITPSGALRWGFSRTRKITRLRYLLQDINIPFTEGRKNSDPKPVTTFTVFAKHSSIIRELLDPDKTLPWWWLQLPLGDRQIVLDELKHWDGHLSDRRTVYCSFTSKNIDVIQAMAAITGRKSRIINQSISVATHHLSRTENIKTTTSPYIGIVACLSVPSSTVLVRDKGVPLICHQTTGFGMANIIGANSLSRELINAGAGKEWDTIKAQELIDAWLRAYPGVKNHFDTVRRFITNYGYVLDMWGRREYIPQIYSCNERTREEGHRIACNQILQSGAQQMMKVMMAAVWEGGLKDWVKNNICYPLLQIHDDLVVYCREERAAEVSNHISRIMSISPEWFSVPVKSEAKIGPSWGEMKKKA